MLKRKPIRAAVALILLAALFSSGAGALAATDICGVTAEEYWMERDGQWIYGRLYLPDNAAFPLPLFILSHGLGSDHAIMEPYAEIFAENGFASYVFDYIGGSENSLSNGSMEECM